MKTNNPILNLEKFFKTSENRSETMTLGSTISKTLVLFVLVLLGASASLYTLNMGSMQLFGSLTGLSAITGLILGLVTIFKPNVAYITAPFYSLCQGFALSSLSVFASQQVSGIVPCALYGTGIIFVALLIGYKTGIIKVNDTFRSVLSASCIGIIGTYAINFIMQLFGSSLSFIHSADVLGLIYTGFILVVASMSLVASFDNIYQAAENNLPKSVEWYASFGLIVSILWVYVEILNLLLKVSRRR